MKRILVVLFSLICFIGYAQTPYPTPYTQQGSPSTLVQVRGGWKADSTAMMPKYVDTITANLYKTKLYAGSIIFTTGDGNYWYRSADAARWLLFGNSVTNCLGTQLISGSITWSGSGLIFDATDLDYSIICTRYSSSATTLTLSTADPTYARIDKLYADITGNVGVITGTPAPNPQEPVINPLSQLDMGIVYIPAGSTVPAGTTQTIIYNENVEFIGTSDVPSINFAYATNPYIGSLSTYIPNAPNSSYVEWQSNGIDYLFSDAQYLKFWVRLNANFTVDPLSFLDVTFEYTDVTVSQTLAVGNGDYNMDYSLINQWQLVSIPLTGITTFGTEFNEVHFVINSAPSSFQLDYVYLLETATVPPAPVGGTWLLNGNSAINDATQYIGTRDAKKLNFGTNGQIRAYIDTAGIDLLIDDTTANVMLIDSNGKVWKTYQPTILADSPLVIYLVGNQRHIKADTTRRGAALATQYYADSVANAGGSGWSLTGNAGTTAGTNFVGTTDNQNLVFKRNNVLSGTIGTSNTSYGESSLLTGVGFFTTAVGVNSLKSTSTTATRNTAIGYNALTSSTSGQDNTAIGVNSLSSNTTSTKNTSVGSFSLTANTGENNIGLGYGAGRSNTTGRNNIYIGVQTGAGVISTGIDNTIIGTLADGATSSTDSSVAIGYQASASTKQVAFSPHLTTMFLDLDSASGTAPAIAGIDANGNWRKYATPSGGSPALTSTYVGVGNVSNVLSGSANFTEDGSQLSYNGLGGMSIPNGGLSVAGGTVSAIDYTGDWAGGIIDPSYGGTGVNNGSKTITIGGNLTTSGAFASTFTMTAATGVTFPTTGTLATLAGSETLTNKDLTASTNVFPSFDYKVLAYNAMGSTLVAQNVNGGLGDATGNNTMVDNRLFLSAVYLPKATTLTGVKWKQVTQGNYTADNYNGIGLYSYSGGTLTLVASTTDDGNIWKAASSTIGSKAFSSTYAAAAGLYFVGAIYSNSAQTTVPVLGSVLGSTGSNTINDFTNSAKLAGFISGLTALPSPTQASSGITAYFVENWYGLY